MLVTRIRPRGVSFHERGRALRTAASTPGVLPPGIVLVQTPEGPREMPSALRLPEVGGRRSQSPTALAGRGGRTSSPHSAHHRAASRTGGRPVARPQSQQPRQARQPQEPTMSRQGRHANGGAPVHAAPPADGEASVAGSQLASLLGSSRGLEAKDSFYATVATERDPALQSMSPTHRAPATVQLYADSAPPPADAHTHSSQSTRLDWSMAPWTWHDPKLATRQAERPPQQPDPTTMYRMDTSMRRTLYQEAHPGRRVNRHVAPERVGEVVQRLEAALTKAGNPSARGTRAPPPATTAAPRGASARTSSRSTARRQQQLQQRRDNGSSSASSQRRGRVPALPGLAQSGRSHGTVEPQEVGSIVGVGGQLSSRRSGGGGGGGGAAPSGSGRGSRGSGRRDATQPQSARSAQQPPPITYNTVPTKASPRSALQFSRKRLQMLGYSTVVQ